MGKVLADEDFGHFVFSRCSHFCMIDLEYRFDDCCMGWFNSLYVCGIGDIAITS